MKSIHSFISARDKVMKGIFAFAAFFSIIALATITIYLFANGLPFIFKHWNTFWGTTWDLKLNSDGEPQYGILSMLVATLYVTALSVLIGVTVGLFTAICLYRFTPKKLVAPISQLVNLLAGIPSIIYGLFGQVVFVPFVRDYLSPNGIGYGILSASFVLSIMVLPTVVSVSLDALRAVPASYFEGALALGATKEQTTFKVLIPAAKSGVLAGVVLSIGRALGETMAVILVVGNSPNMPTSLFQSVRTLTSNIALGAMELEADHKQALVATGVVLFVFTLLINVAFSFLKKDKSGADKKKKKAAAAGNKAEGAANTAAAEATANAKEAITAEAEAEAAKTEEKAGGEADEEQ